MKKWKPKYPRKDNFPVVYSNGHFFVTYAYANGVRYYTVVNMHTEAHSHLPTLQMAKKVANRAAAMNIPPSYSGFLRTAVIRLLG